MWVRLRVYMKFTPKYLSVSAKVWKYPGLLGWYFVSLDRVTSKKIRSMYPKGFVPITATLEGVTWNTSLFPTREGVYLLALKASVRASRGILAGDMVEISYYFR